MPVDNVLLTPSRQGSKCFSHIQMRTSCHEWSLMQPMFVGEARMVALCLLVSAPWVFGRSLWLSEGLRGRRMLISNTPAGGLAPCRCRVV